MDWAIKIAPDKISVVVELKRVNIDLNKNHLKQASRYAIDIGCEWVVLTNSRRWELYHVEFGQPPDTKLISSWNLLLDEPEVLAEKFGMIAFKSVKNGMLDKLTLLEAEPKNLQHLYLQTQILQFFVLYTMDPPLPPSFHRETPTIRA